MDKLDKLIAELNGFKEELAKNVNQSYSSGSPNVSSSSMTGSLEQAEKVNLDNPYGDKMKAGKGEKGRNDKNDKEPELEGPENLKEKEQPSLKKEEIEFNKCGQWSIKKYDEAPSRAEKNMPLHPKPPRPSAKEMGANKKKVLASRHRTGIPDSKDTPVRLKEYNVSGVDIESLAEREKIDEKDKSLKKDATDSKLAPKDRKVKELQQQIDAGKYKPDAGKIADKMLQHKDKPLKKAKDMAGDDVDSSMLMSELQAIEHHIKEIKSKINPKDIAPDWVKSQVSQAANDLSGVAHYILSLKGE